MIRPEKPKADVVYEDGNCMKTIQKYLPHIGIIVLLLGFVWFLFQIDATAGDAKKIAEENQTIQKQLSAIVISNDAKLEVFLQLSGFDATTARRWSEIPRQCVFDSATQLPVVNVEWLRVSESMKTGVLMKVAGYTIEDGDTCAVLVVDTLWQVMN